MRDRHHLPASVISAEDAPAFWRVGILWNIVLSAETTAGQFTMMDQTMPQGSGAPPHVHERYDEGFFIIEGAVEYDVGDGDEQETILAADGAAVWIPRGTRHAFEVKSETARALNFYTPGGFDESISMLATAATAKTLPPVDSGESDPRGFQTDNAKEDAYLQRISELHSQSMP
jgi:quercetin dioxygenase-like cupin family protein